MPDDALTTALKELGRAYNISVRLRKLSADVQANALENEKAMWACMSALRRLSSQDGEWVSTRADPAESNSK